MYDLKGYNPNYIQLGKMCNMTGDNLETMSISYPMNIYFYILLLL